MSVTTTLNLPPVIQGYGSLRIPIDRDFPVTVGGQYLTLVLGRTYLSDGQGNVIEDYLSLPAGVRTVFEEMVYGDIRAEMNRLGSLIAESRSALQYLRSLGVK